jgi:hypothetical protein
MGCHFCADEMFAIVAILSGIKYIPGWIRTMWNFRHTKFKVGSCRHGDGHDHGESK